MKLVPSGCLVASLVSCMAHPARVASPTPESVAVMQHRYQAGETIEYLFEDTDLTYGAVAVDSSIQPTTLRQVEELRIPFTITVSGDSAGALRRTLRFHGAVYRSGKPEEFSSLSPRPLEEVVPELPSGFSYAYETDSKAVSSGGVAFMPYMRSAVGQFLYYKDLDIHTMQSVIDGIPATLRPGQLDIKAAQDFALPQGTFRNASSVLLYSGVQTLCGVRCGYFKVVNMGNSFQYQRAGHPATLHTNYQYTFTVPLEGPDAGLLLSGELQETATTAEGTIIQRQFSMRLVRHDLPGGPSSR